MKKRLLAFCFLGALFCGASADAATLFWSGNGTTLGGAGTWDTTNARWGTSSSGPFTTVWANANGDSATLSAGSGATGGGSVVIGTAITMAGTLTWQQTPGTFASYSINGTAVMTFSAGSVLSCNNSVGGSLTVGSFNSPYAGTITKSGTGGVTFNNANGTVTKFIFNQGTANFAAPSRFGAGADVADFLTFNGGAISFNTTTAWTMGKSITVNSGGGTIAPGSATITITQDKPITWNSGTLTVSTSPLVLSSTTSSGTGTLTLSTAVSCNAAGVIPSTVRVNSSSSLTLNNNNQNIKTLSGAGTVSLGSATLTLSNPAGETASGAISGSGGSVTKNGSGNWTISGANTYSGTTTVNAGTLTLGANNALPGASTLNLAGGTLAMGANSATVKTLQFSGSVKAKGTWGSASSSATHQDAQFTGTGILTVTNGGASVSSLASSQNPSQLGDPVTVTATVTGSNGNGSTPGGSVTVYDGASPLCTTAVSGSGLVVTGVCVLTAAQLPVGNHNLTVQYSGDSNYDKSTSSVLVQTVNPPPLSVSCPSNIIVTTTGSAGTVVNFSVTASGGCPPVTVVATPPSGSVFPVGTTTVTATANDACGQNATCSFTVTVLSDPCYEVDNGSGTVTLPPANCPYLSPDQVHMIIDGLPPGTTIELTTIHRDFICHQGGGGSCSNDCFTVDDCDPSNGATEVFDSTLELHLRGTGLLAGWNRDLVIPNVFCQSQVGPRTPYAPTQEFDTEMMSIQGQLPPGDPDFDLLRVTAGSSFGMPSPGHTTLLQQPGGTWAVYSFFDITYRIDFVGHPGGALGGMSGSTTGTIRMKAGPPPPAVTVTCPSNITVTATSPAGAVVSFTPSASGGCTTPVITANPPSGSTFPIGTTVVTVTATDNCAQSAQCTFTVTVNPQPTVQGPEYFVSQPVLPPPGSVYISPAQWHVLYNMGIVIRDVRHHFFTQNYPLPPLGSSQVETFSSQLDFELSTDNGATFAPASGTANVTVQVTHSQDVGTTMFFDTEMLQLDLVGPGFTLRESPTLQSLGQTSVRPVPGGFMINSFFDIFTEISTDAGISWTPAQQAGHVEMRPDPATVNPVSHPTDQLPPPTGAYVSPQQWHALFAQGIVIKDVSHKFFTDAQHPPSTGTNTESFNSVVDLSISLDGGATFQFARVAAPVTVGVGAQGSGSSRFYDTEMLSLNLVGLPGGVMIRESPTLPSRGCTAMESSGLPPGDPDFDLLRVHSFFDIFTEVSTDGGATWAPATNGPVRMELVPVAPEVPKPDPNLPPLDGNYVSPQQWHALYANGIIITNASHDRFTQTQPPPPPGGSQTENFGSRVTGMISMNGGASFQPFSAPAGVAVQVNSHSSLDSATTRFFDTEMLSLSLSGGTLPGGVMVRESPSKASLGRTSVRATPGDYRIGSFFDIFTEVSLDGGATWSPSVTAPGTMGLTTNGPPPPALEIACPSNITVTATSPAGAVVFYTVTASGGCPPLNVVANPPSGSTFPIGTTTVTATATDNCGQSAQCSFTVTVNPQPTPQGPEYFFPQPLLPPPGSVYISPAQWHVLYAQGIVIRDVRHRFFTQNYPLPPLGSSQTESFSSQLDFELSTDNGATFTPASGTANVTVQVTHSQDVGTTMFFDTEMLQLDLSGPGFILRESPTLQSTGQTTERPAPGGYMISSFFDIFTEVSTDGGVSWTPAQGPGHVECHPDPKQVTPAPAPTPILPPPNGAYVSPQQWHALYAQGIVIKDVSHRLFTGALQPPPPGGTNVHNFNSQLDLQVSSDGGSTYQSVRVAAPVQVTVASHGSSSDTIYDTEMSQLDLSLPGGILIRESPTLPSRGQVEIDAQPDGTYRISSFFDIFTELSLDGGASWAPATNGPVRVELVPIAPEVPKPNPLLPPLDGNYVSPQQWHALYANGIILTNVSHSKFTQTQPPPPPGGSQTENFGSEVSGLISMNGGASFQPFAGSGSVAVQVNSRADEDIGNTRFFDTEMLSLQLSGGSLPGGVMVRESPSKASLGRTSVRTDGGQFQISSFFDIFTEVSLDGGATWTPSVTRPGTMGLVSNSPPPALSITCPSNITVTATSPAGAVVFYTVTASGGCPPVNVVANPPSGSTFPIGTTTVTATATDNCSQSAQCSFTVTVRPAVPEYFFPQSVLPPPGSVYISPAQWHVLYNMGIVIRDVRHRFFTQNYPLPPLGSSQTESFSSQLDFELSMDNGATFQPASGTANVTVQVTHTQDGSGGQQYDTEMLQLELTGPGFILRESPTLQSLGQTTVRPVAGGYMISSFFDIFTEVTTDGGVTWHPAQQAGHVELRPDPATVNPVSHPTDLLPPPNGAYVSPQQWHALYAQGIVIKDVSHKFFTDSQHPPSTGSSNTHFFNSVVDLSISTDGGATYQFVRVAAPVTVGVGAEGSSSSRFYDTEMLSLNLVGLPGGIMIRESPTLPSRGCTAMESSGLPPGDPDFDLLRIHSFFDIFTEVSLDGGATWAPATNGPVRMELVPVAPEVPKPTPNLPPTDGSYISPAKWHALYANGIIITNASHDRFTQTQPPPPPGGSQTENFGSQVTGMISMNGGATFQPFSAPASVAVKVDSHSSLDSATTRFFDTEMLSLSLTGGTLPGGLMVRESPTRASVGRTSVRTTPGDYRIGSFFDIFTEVSLDGGATWTPSVTAPASMGLSTNQPGVAVNITCPSNIVVMATGPSGATVFYTVTASGGCTPPTIVANPPSGSTFPVGTTTVTATASDTCGNSAECTFTVTVYPQLTIDCPSNITASATGPNGATVFYTVNASGGCTPPPFVTANPPSGSTFPVGTTTVTATASDNCGNTNTCNFTVTVYPQLGITCPSNMAVAATGPSGAVVFYSVTASGGCTPPTIVANPPSGSTFPIGTTMVTATASDTCGNSAECTFTVTVYQPVSITCPTNITADATGPSGAVVFFSVDASGGCTPPPFVTANPPSGSTFPIGTTTVTATASDNCGNSAMCSFTVTVTAPPINLSCSSNITVAATSPNGAVVFFTSSATGGCSPPPTVMCNPPSGSTFPIGTTMVTCTASDSCGSATNCSFTVTVVQPVITIAPVGGLLQLTWPTGTLQDADDVTGPYIDVDPQPSSPHTIAPTNSGKFFRVRFGTNGFTYYDTEMLQLDISGGSLPPGMRLRESPTLASTGKTAISPAPGGGFMISSFFDVFTEISLDNGQTWLVPTNPPPRMRFVGTTPSDTLPPKDGNYVSPQQWHALYAQGIYITNASHLGFVGGSFPPPPPGGVSDTHTFGSTVNLQIKTCPTCPLQPITAPAQVTVRVTSRP